MARKKEGRGRVREGTVPVRGQSPAAPERIRPNKHRKVQIARTGGRKLFDEAAQAVFLEWFAATCNLAWSAEMAGFNYKTVLRHRMNDARFREGWDRAVEQSYARLEAKRLETRRKEAPIGIEGDWDAPEMDEMAPERIDAILRERGRPASGGEPARRQGRRPHVASNAEVREALTKRLKAFYARERARLGAREDPPRNGEGERACEAGPGDLPTAQPDAEHRLAAQPDGGGAEAWSSAHRPLRQPSGLPPPRSGEDLQ